MANFYIITSLTTQKAKQKVIYLKSLNYKSDE